jgi:hypothetical protein
MNLNLPNLCAIVALTLSLSAPLAQAQTLGASAPVAASSVVTGEAVPASSAWPGASSESAKATTGLCGISLGPYAATRRQYDGFKHQTPHRAHGADQCWCC